LEDSALTPESLTEPCPSCFGRGEITVLGHTAPCPECMATGVVERDWSTAIHEGDYTYLQDDL